MTTQPARILFLGTHGQRNIGDELLLETFLDRLGTENRYVINTYDKVFTGDQLAGRYSVELIDTAGDRVQLVRQLLRCDLLVFGGGSIIKELYASTGRNRYSTLAMILAVVTVAHLLARKPIAMLNVGVGPIRTSTGRRLARLILSQVDLLVVRDAKSHQTCLSVGIAPDRVELSADAVFSTDPAWLLTDPRPGAGPDSSGTRSTSSSAPTATPVDGRPLRVALNLNFHIENPDNWELFLDRLAEGLRRFHRLEPIELHALPMQSGFKTNDDADILAGFADRLPGITMHQHQPANHADVARLVSDCDLLISERLHAIVIASVLGVPSLVLAYDVKVLQLASMLDLESSTIDINAPFEASEVVDRLHDLVEGRVEKRAGLLARSSVLRAQAGASLETARAWVEGRGGRTSRSAADTRPFTATVTR